MRVLETTISLPEPHAPYGQGVYLGLVGDADLADLVEGERVTLVEPYDVQIEAIVHKVTVADNRLLWFGEFQGDYQYLSAETPAVSKPV